MRRETKNEVTLDCWNCGTSEIRNDNEKNERKSTAEENISLSLLDLLIKETRNGNLDFHGMIHNPIEIQHAGAPSHLVLCAVLIRDLGADISHEEAGIAASDFLLDSLDDVGAGFLRLARGFHDAAVGDLGFGLDRGFLGRARLA